MAAEEGIISNDKSPKVGLRQRLWPSKKKAVESNTLVAPRSPARVEPKSFYANERTFIQWVSAAMTIVVVAELIFLTATEQTSVSALRAGNFLFATALVVVVYGISLYYRRLYLMMTSKPYGYADAIGPAVFAIILIVGISLIIHW